MMSLLHLLGTCDSAPLAWTLSDVCHQLTRAWCDQDAPDGVGFNDSMSHLPLDLSQKISRDPRWWKPWITSSFGVKKLVTVNPL